MLFQCVDRRRTARDYPKVTAQTAAPNTEVVLLARISDVEVARGRILLGPTERGSTDWVPSYLDGAAAVDGLQHQKRTKTRVVVAVSRIKSPAAVLLYPTEEGIETIGAAMEKQQERELEVLHVLWDMGRVRIVEEAAGGGGAGAGAAAGGDGGVEGAEGVHTRETTEPEYIPADDEWEGSGALDEEIRDAMGEEEGAGAAEGGEEEGEEEAGEVVVEQEEEEDEDDDEEGGGWGTTGCSAAHGGNVKLDALHAHQRITRTVRKDHGAFRLFAARLRDALMMPLKGDVEIVKQRLIGLGVVTEAGWKEHFGRNYTAVTRICRREIPKPSVLMQRMRAVERTFARIKDAETGQPLFMALTWKRWKALMRHVEKGCLSDPPPDYVSLYHKVGIRRDGTDILSCARGTSDLKVGPTNSVSGGYIEGGEEKDDLVLTTPPTYTQHTHPKKTQGCHQEMARLSGGKNTGPEMMLGMFKESAYRWNLGQDARHHGLDPALRGHFEHFVVEEIQVLTEGWFDDPLYPGWRSTKDFADTGETFGVVRGVQQQQQQQQSDDEQKEEGAAAAASAAAGGDRGDEEEDGKEEDEPAEDPEADEEAEMIEVEGEAYLVGCTPSARCVDWVVCICSVCVGVH